MLQPMKRQQNVQNSPVLQMMRWSVDAICEKNAGAKPSKKERMQHRDYLHIISHT
jgi:hypothetical protein